MNDLVGQVVNGQYEVRELIGSGATSVVYRAFDKNIRRDVALKVIDVRQTSDANSTRRAEKEVGLIAQLQHPHIVPLYDYWFEPDSSVYYLVMRLINGGSLRERLASRALTIDETVRLFDQITDALAFAHEQKVIHRDVKPANIFLDGRGNAYLGDFGFSKVITDTGLSLIGTAIGTPDYGSLEQLAGQATVTPALDIYSLGIVLFECLAGSHPFPKNPVQHLIDPLPSLRSILPNIPLAVDNVIRCATERKTENRYKDVRGFYDAFVEALNQLDSVISSQYPDPIDSVYHSVSPFEPKDLEGQGLSPFDSVDNLNDGRTNQVDYPSIGKIFISYQRKPSLLLALLVYNELLDHGLDVFLDITRIDGADSLSITILQEIENCSVFVCLLADGTLNSAWVDKEIKHAHSLKKPMIPVLQKSIQRKMPTSKKRYIKDLLDKNGLAIDDEEGHFIKESISELRENIERLLYEPPSKNSDPEDISNGEPKPRPLIIIVVIANIIIFLLFIFLSLFNSFSSPNTAQTASAETAVLIAKTSTFAAAIAQTNAATLIPVPTTTYTDTPRATNTPTDTPLPTNTTTLTATSNRTDTPTPSDTATSAPSATSIPTASPLPLPIATPTTVPPTETSIPPTDVPTNTDTPALTTTSTPSPTEEIPIAGMWQHESMTIRVFNQQDIVDVIDLSQCASPDANSQPLCVDKPFRILALPVKNQQYRHCFEANKCQPPTDELDARLFNPNLSESPVVHVTWSMALNYCVAIGGTLPTEKEWKYAALGINNIGASVREWVSISDDLVVMSRRAGREIITTPNLQAEDIGFRCVFY